MNDDSIAGRAQKLRQNMELLLLRGMAVARGHVSSGLQKDVELEQLAGGIGGAATDDDALAALWILEHPEHGQPTA